MLSGVYERGFDPRFARQGAKKWRHFHKVGPCSGNDVSIDHRRWLAVSASRRASSNSLDVSLMSKASSASWIVASGMPCIWLAMTRVNVLVIVILSVGEMTKCPSGESISLEAPSGGVS